MQVVGPNFTFESQTGKIVYFGNIQNTPRKFDTHKYKRHTFIVALKMQRSGQHTKVKYRIVNYFSPKKCNAKALVNLRLSVTEYNKTYGFQIPGLWNKIKQRIGIQ